MKTALSALALAVLASAGAASAQGPTKEDSGWVSVWNGTDFNGFYVYVGKKGYTTVANQTMFKAENGTIHADGPYALLTTLKEYSYYKVRVDYHWESTLADGAGNAGLMILMDNEAAKTVVTDNRPRSIEVNCRRNSNYPWSLWAGKGFGPYITSTVKQGTDQYLPKDKGGVEFTFDITDDNNRVVRSTFPNTELPAGQWNHGEAHVYGDSGMFYLNGQIRTAGWKWVVKGANGQMVKVDKGGIAVQSEGTQVWYRNWEVMELDPQTRLPINARRGCTDKTKPNYDPRAVIDNGCGPSAVISPLRTWKGPESGVYTVEGRRIRKLGKYTQVVPFRLPEARR